MSRYNKNNQKFLYKSKPTIHMSLSNHSLCWVECNSLHGKQHALKRKLLLSVRLLQSTGYISHLRCKVGILGQQWTLFITHSCLLLYFYTLDLLPWFAWFASILSIDCKWCWGCRHFWTFHIQYRLLFLGPSKHRRVVSTGRNGCRFRN